MRLSSALPSAPKTLVELVELSVVLALHIKPLGPAITIERGQFSFVLLFQRLDLLPLFGCRRH
jgi:hypothetical protein